MRKNRIIRPMEQNNGGMGSSTNIDYDYDHHHNHHDGDDDFDDYHQADDNHNVHSDLFNFFNNHQQQRLNNQFESIELKNIDHDGTYYRHDDLNKDSVNSNSGRNSDNPIAVESSVDRGHQQQQQQQQEHHHEQYSNPKMMMIATTAAAAAVTAKNMNNQNSTSKMIMNPHLYVNLIKKCIQLVIDDRQNENHQFVNERPSSSSKSSMREKKSWFFGQPSNGHNHLGRMVIDRRDKNHLKDNSDSLHKSSYAERLDSFWKDLKGIRYKKQNGKIVQIGSRRNRNSMNSDKNNRVNKRMILLLMNLSVAKPLLEKIQSKEQLKRLENALKMSGNNQHMEQQQQQENKKLKSTTTSTSSLYDYRNHLQQSSLSPFDVDQLKLFKTDSNDNLDLLSQQSSASMKTSRNSDDEDSSLSSSHSIMANKQSPRSIEDNDNQSDFMPASLFGNDGANLFTLSPQLFPTSTAAMTTSATMKIIEPITTKINRQKHHAITTTTTTTGTGHTVASKSSSSRLIETDRPVLETPLSKKLLSQKIILDAIPWDKEGIRFKRDIHNTGSHFFQSHLIKLIILISNQIFT